VSLVIVTSNQYILASKIYDITLEENYHTMEYRNSKGKLVGASYRVYTINVHYVPANPPNPSSSREDVRGCSITIESKSCAHKVYQDLIRQIREQMPDELYLDKAFEHLLEIKDAPLDEEGLPMEEELDDTSTKKIRRARKTKKDGKKVLRRSKRSNRSRSR
jgi:hypothetical protein